jgi:hypothetical protein
MDTSSSRPVIYRQGDVLLARVASLPADAVPVPRDGDGRLVLAYGEATGHAHVVTAVDPSATVDAELLIRPDDQRDLEVRFLRVEREARLVHDEHATIPLDPGVYRVVRQREYAPEAIRNVAD